jgi:hypothetical protein
MDDGGGGDVEAHPERGPIYNEHLERVPLTWVDVAILCFLGAFTVGVVAGGVVTMVLPARLGPDGVPTMSHTTSVAIGSVIVVMGSVATALWVYLVKIDCQSHREVDAMTRLHVVPVCLADDQDKARGRRSS